MTTNPLTSMTHEDILRLTDIEYLERDLQVSRLTATKYLDQLAQAGFLEKRKIWRNNYYISRPLFDLLTNSPEV